ncbi:MAG: TonB-dependent siderophore receptor, partial [Novosphingobium sp.]
LRYVPGVVLGQGEGHRDQVTVRGQNSTADFFIDGLRDEAQYYRPLYNTERVEVLKGANAMIFGRGGGGGVINRVTKAALHDKAAVGGHASMDSYGAWAIAADVNQPLSDAVALRINATREEFANHRDSYDGRFNGAAATASARLSDATTLQMAYEYADDSRVTDRGIPSVRAGDSLVGTPLRGHYRTFFGKPGVNRGEVTAHIARARLDHRFSENLSANLTGQFATYDKYYANVYARAATPTTADFEGYANWGKRENWIVQGNMVWKGETGPVAHTLLAGFEASDQDTQDSRKLAQFGAGETATTGPIALTRPMALPSVSFTGLTRANATNVRVLSAYIQDQIEIGEYLQVIGGVRFDDFRIRSTNHINGFAATRSDSKWSPRVGVIAKPRENISVYASYALSFLPQSGDQFTVLDPVTSTLAPEKFRNLEAGVKWDLTPALGLTMAVYQLDRTNSRSTDPITGNPVLTGKSRAKGFEIALAGRITDAWQASLGYALQDGEIRSATTAGPSGRKLAQLPKHQITAWTRYDFTDRVGAGLGMIHQSAQFATISNAVRLPSFTRFDAAVYFDVTKNFTFQLNAENLTNERYFPSAHTDNNISTGKPFTVRATARLKL